MATKEKDNQETQQERRIAVVRQATGEKANGTTITYEIGREEGTDNLFLRLIANDGGGTFSKEWVSFEALHKIARDVAKTKKPFAPGPMVAGAYVGKSRNNGPFLAYALKAEGLLERAGEKGTQAQVAGDWDAWKASQLKLTVPKMKAASDTKAEERKRPRQVKTQGNAESDGSE